MRTILFGLQVMGCLLSRHLVECIVSPSMDLLRPQQSCSTAVIWKWRLPCFCLLFSQMRATENSINDTGELWLGLAKREASLRFRSSLVEMIGFYWWCVVTILISLAEKPPPRGQLLALRLAWPVDSCHWKAQRFTFNLQKRFWSLVVSSIGQRSMSQCNFLVGFHLGQSRRVEVLKENTKSIPTVGKAHCARKFCTRLIVNALYALSTSTLHKSYCCISFEG